MKKRFDLVLPFPVLIFVLGAFLYVETQNEARVQFLRAQEQWRQGHYGESIDLYEGILRDYPKSRYADQALWEMGTIHYVNFYHVDRAAACFQKLLRQYPKSLLVEEVKLRLAQIYEADLGDLSRAITYWQQVLARDSSADLQRKVCFKMADALFKINRIEEAREHFQRVIEASAGDHLSEQSRIRLGIILQIQKDYRGSVDWFQQVLTSTQCGDCRIQAQLGLIESYEFMEELARAIETAQAIRHEDYPLPVKEGLLERLKEKGKYYGRQRW